MFWWGKELAKTIWVVGKAFEEDAGTVPQGDSETFTSTEMLLVCPSWAQMGRVGEGDEIQLL